MFIIDQSTSIEVIKGLTVTRCPALKGVLPVQLRAIPACVKALEITTTENKQKQKKLHLMLASNFSAP